jgi:hypothetical protein
MGGFRETVVIINSKEFFEKEVIRFNELKRALTE